MRIPFLEKNDAHEFKPLLAEIEERPLNPLGRVIMLMILSTILFFALWMYLGMIDIVVTARGAVLADGQNKIIQPLETGIVAQILVREGDMVKKGQPLMEIDPSTTQPELHSTDENLRYARLEIERIEATLSQNGFSPASKTHDLGSVDTQRRLYDASINNLQRELAAKEAELKSIDSQLEHTKIEQQENEALLKVALEKDERLARVADIVAKDEIEKHKTDILNYKNNIAQEGHKIAELQQKQAQIQHEIAKVNESFREKQLQELGDKQKRATELHAKLKELTFKNSKQLLLSPCAGTVNQLFFHTVGGVVTPAEKLMSIVPADSSLVVKAEVQNQDIGFVATGQNVAIKADTYEFQKYGMYEGKVKLISKDSHEDEQKKELGKIYDVYITPTNKYLTVEGRKEYLKPGMTVTAEVKVGKRRIIEFFVYPLIKYWQEGMSVR